MNAHVGRGFHAGVFESATVTAEELREVLTRLACAEFSPAEATIGSISEITGASPLVIERILDEYRSRPIDEVLEEHDARLQVLERMAQVPPPPVVTEPYDESVELLDHEPMPVDGTPRYDLLEVEHPADTLTPRQWAPLQAGLRELGKQVLPLILMLSAIFLVVLIELLRH